MTCNMSSVPLSLGLRTGTRDRWPQGWDGQWDSCGTLMSEGPFSKAPVIRPSGTPTGTNAGHHCPATLVGSEDQWDSGHPG